MNYTLTTVCCLVLLCVHLACADDCDANLALCRQQQQAGGPVNTGAVKPDFSPGKCDYEKQQFWLLPGEADNSSCTRPEVRAKGLKILIYNETVRVTPNPIRLPGCFNMTFDVEILDSINQVPNSYIGKNEFQLFELPDIEKMQCQNASNNGCGGYGNNCIYCDVCEQLKRIRNRDPNRGQRTDQQEQFLKQFDDVSCPNKAGIYTVTRQLCFNDYSVLDKDHNCQIDFLEDLAKTDSGKNDAETVKAAYRALLNKGFSTLVARFYLSNNATDVQLQKKQAKEAEIEANADADIAKQRQSKQLNVTDGDLASFRKWYIQYQKDKWHKDKYLPWLIYENELACLKVTFTVCDKEPVPLTDTDKQGGGAATEWWQQRGRPQNKCPT